MVIVHSYVSLPEGILEAKNLVAQLSSNLRMEIICVAMRSRQGEHPLRSGSDHHPAISRGWADGGCRFPRVFWADVLGTHPPRNGGFHSFDMFVMFSY